MLPQPAKQEAHGPWCSAWEPTWPWAKLSSKVVIYVHSLSIPGLRNWAYFRSMGSGFRDNGWFSKLPYLGMKLACLAKVVEVAHIHSFYPRGSQLSLFSLYGQSFLRYWTFFKIAIFGHETWPLAKVPEIAHIHCTVFLPQGVKLSLFLIYGQRFQRYRRIVKIAQNCHIWAWNLAIDKVPEVAHVLSSYSRGSKLNLFSLYGQRFLKYGTIFKIFGLRCVLIML